MGWLGAADNVLGQQGAAVTCEYAMRWWSNGMGHVFQFSRNAVGGRWSGRGWGRGWGGRMGNREIYLDSSLIAFWA